MYIMQGCVSGICMHQCLKGLPMIRFSVQTVAMLGYPTWKPFSWSGTILRQMKSRLWCRLKKFAQILPVIGTSLQYSMMEETFVCLSYKYTMSSWSMTRFSWWRRCWFTRHNTPTKHSYTYSFALALPNFNHSMLWHRIWNDINTFKWRCLRNDLKIRFTAYSRQLYMCKKQSEHTARTVNTWLSSCIVTLGSLLPLAFIMYSNLFFWNSSQFVHT